MRRNLKHARKRLTKLVIDMIKSKEKVNEYAQMLISMSTDFLMGGIDQETFTTNLLFAAKNLKEDYDSTADTLFHIKRVSELLSNAAVELLKRASIHDASKLQSPEKELFDEFTPKLKNTTYGSDEYHEHLKGLKVALDHHYASNSHHPEHYENGVNGMDLFDLIEMFFDWKAATERHADGDIYKSIEINKKRFDLSDQLAGILKNTADNL